MPNRAKPFKCQACSDKCEKDISTYCDEPVTVKANIDYIDRHYMTLYPTSPEKADPAMCAQTKSACQDMFATSCDNMYRIENKTPQVAISGMGRG